MDNKGFSEELFLGIIYMAVIGFYICRYTVKAMSHTAEHNNL